MAQLSRNAAQSSQEIRAFAEEIRAKADSLHNGHPERERALRLADLAFMAAETREKHERWLLRLPEIRIRARQPNARRHDERREERKPIASKHIDDLEQIAAEEGATTVILHSEG